MLLLLDAQRCFAAAIDAHRVYRANVWGNWAKALAGAYPIVQKIVGEEFFRGMARAYGRAHPSTSGDLNEYGAALAGFVAEFEPTQDLPYLSDVARMEWLVHRAYYAADPPGFSSSDLPGRPEDVALRLAPPCAILDSPWPLARIWTIHQEGHRGSMSIDWQQGGAVLVYRPAWRVEVRALAEGDHRFLAGAQRGAALGEALEAGCADPSFDPSIALSRALVEGVLTP